ncbi:MAG: hypothetical protein WKF30_04465 [Pyrinomonadaceae bacterium]
MTRLPAARSVVTARAQLLQTIARADEVSLRTLAKDAERVKLLRTLRELSAPVGCAARIAR